MKKNQFQVVITNQLGNDQEQNLVIIQKLAALFKMDSAKAALLLSHPRTVIKDNLDEATAKKYYFAIQQTGAHCELINKDIAADLPHIIEPPKPPPLATTTRTSKPDISNEFREPALSMVAREAKDQNETAVKLDALKHTGADTLCPDCGTIRGSIDAICLHCGYNPALTEAPETTERRKPWLIVMIMAVVLLIVIAGLFFAIPWYQNKMQQETLEQRFKPAFEVRNQVAAFIEHTNFFPNQNLDANLPDHISSAAIASIDVGDNAIITVTMKPDAAGGIADQTLIFLPRKLQDKIVWNCLQGTLANEFRPAVCRN